VTYDPSDVNVLVIDDDHAVGTALRRILERAGYGEVVVETNPESAILRWADRDFDAVILDLHMPGVDGFGVMRALVDQQDREDYTPILVVTGDQRIDVRQRALASGAKDFVQKPFEPTEVVARLRNLVDTSRMHRRLRSFNDALTIRVEEGTEELLSAKLEVLERLARAGEYRDDMTGLHAKRVGVLSGLLARELSVDEERASMIERTAPLHDIGKIGVPDGILLKEGALTPEEVEIIRGHTFIGAGILSGSHFDVLQTAERIALTHHEHWNGRGYPQMLIGAAIPLEGRIVSVADAFDSLTNDRPYRRACSHDLAITEIVAWRDRQFDPDIVDAICRLHRRGTLAELAQVVAKVAGVPLGNGPVVEGTVGTSPSTPDAASPWDPSPPPGAREPSTRPRP
jgi:putative two-component system response regulator